MGDTSLIIMLAGIVALLCVAQIHTLPQPGNQIDWRNIEARYPTFTPWSPTKDLPKEVLASILKMGPPTSQRYPNYKKGTLNLSAECGIAGGSRIVGGEEVAPHSYPWMAALFVDEKWFCGGTLISDEWVLTAGHCAHGAKKMKVMLGAHNVRQASEEGRIELETTKFFTHPDYSSITIHNDLALVHLPQKVEFGPAIRPVCLPAHSEAGESFAHLQAVATGWGKPSDDASSISPVLRGVDVDTITNFMCALEFPFQMTKNVICISGANGKSTCNGDSGGPLYLVTDGVHKQIGITSFGSASGCEKGWHAAFTRPTSYLQWIETETNVQIDP